MKPTGEVPSDKPTDKLHAKKCTPQKEGIRFGRCSFGSFPLQAFQFSSFFTFFGLAFTHNRTIGSSHGTRNKVLNRNVDLEFRPVPLGPAPCALTWSFPQNSVRSSSCGQMPHARWKHVFVGAGEKRSKSESVVRVPFIYGVAMHFFLLSIAHLGVFLMRCEKRSFKLLALEE